MGHFFSVIICTYNRARLLPRALDSLLAQSETDWEAIVVDDGSIDNTAEVVDRYSGVCKNIHLFQRKHNRGVGAARNIGVKIAKGRFVTFLDSDDEYSVEHLAKRRDALVNSDTIRFLHGGIKVIGDPYVVDKDDPSKKIHLASCAVGGTFVIKADVFDQIGGFEDLPYAEDAAFLDKAINSGVKCDRVDLPTYIYYRDTHGQITRQREEEIRNERVVGCHNVNS